MADVFEKRLSNFIASFLEVEKRSEVVRKILAEQKLFEPYTAFRRLDQERKSYIDEANLLEFFRDNQIPITDSIVSILFRLIDHDGDGKILFSDFHRYILTKDEKLKQLVNLRDSYFIDKNMLLPNEVEWSLARLFQIQTEGLIELFQSREELIQIKEFFKNQGQKTQLRSSAINLYQFMTKQGHNVTPQDIHIIMGYFEKYSTDSLYMATLNYFSKLFGLQEKEQTQQQTHKLLNQESQAPKIFVQEEIQIEKQVEPSQQAPKLNSTPEKSLNKSQIVRDLTPVKSQVPTYTSYYGYQSRTIKNNKIDLPSFKSRQVPDEVRSQFQGDPQDQALERLKLLNVKAHELDRAIQIRTQQKIDTLNKLKGMNPQARYQYFNPNQRSTYNIMQAINKYKQMFSKISPQFDNSRNMKNYQDDTISCFTQNSYQKIPKTSDNSYFSSHSNLKIYG